MGKDKEPITSLDVYAAEGFAALQRAAEHMAADRCLEEAARCLEIANQKDAAHDCHRVVQLHRLAVARLAGVIRRFGEGESP
jgi:hypothetical protein